MAPFHTPQPSRMREAQALEFDIVVIGAGLFGSACAKHLGLLTGGDKRICLIGPEEPHDRADSNVNTMLLAVADRTELFSSSVWLLA